LQSNEKALAEKHADLLAAHLLLLIEIKHFRDDEQVVIVMLDLRPLARVEHVFESEWVEVESFSEQAQHIDVAETVDVDPRDPFIIEMREKLIAVGDEAFLEMRSIVFNQSDDWRMPLGIGAKSEHTGRFARNGLTDFEHSAFCRKAHCSARRKRAGPQPERPTLNFEYSEGRNSCDAAERAGLGLRES
jgi:hypothetical protein